VGRKAEKLEKLLIDKKLKGPSEEKAPTQIVQGREEPELRKLLAKVTVKNVHVEVGWE